MIKYNGSTTGFELLIAMAFFFLNEEIYYKVQQQQR